MKYTMNDIIKKLEAYPSMREKITLLHYELEHPAAISPDEMIQAMSFSHEGGIGRPTSSVSNKTMYIAMNYQTEAARLSSDVMDEVVSKLIPLERELDRLDYYLSFLDTHQREAVEKCFFEKSTLQKAADALSVSVWSVRKHRDDAVEKLTEMYCFVGENSK